MIKTSRYCIEEQEALRVHLNGRELISRDTFTNVDLTESSQLELTTDTINGTSVFNTYNAAGDQFRYRREVAVNADQRLEITTRMQLLPYSRTKQDAIDYHLYLPFELIAGGSFKAWSGKSGGGRNKLVSGKAGDSLSEMRYIAFTACKMDLVIDFNPYGITDWMDYCKWGNATGRWQMEKEGDYLKLSSPNIAHFQGGIYARKIMIYESEWDFEERHPYDNFSYTGSTESRLRLGFGSTCPDLMTVNGQRYSNSTEFGWDPATELNTIGASSPGETNGCVWSDDHNGNFKIKVPPGYYILPITCLNTANNSGPFSISLNGKEQAKDIVLPKGQKGEFILHAYVRDGICKLDFSGEKWCISTISVQTLIYQGEDFFIDRGFWHNNNLPDFIDDKCPPEIHKKTLASGGNESLNTDENWRYSAKITHLGNSCYDSRNIMTRQADVERRIKEIYDEGFSVMMLDGWHMWPCFQDKLGEWTELTAQKVEVAHRYGIRVIDHFDVPCIVYANTGFDFLLKSLDWCQRDIRFGEPTLKMFCLNNPGFRKLFLDFLEEYARYTKIDAVMLDECTFAGKDFCGCRHCRQKFTEDTNLVLPSANNSEHFFNLESKLWTAWLKWRQKTIGDWWVDVKQALHKGSPGASVMQYITHYGFASSWAPMELGIDLMENSRACDFLGTEIMTRNIMDSYRSVNAYRKMKTPLSRKSTTPLFAFNYHCGIPDLAYFGWALMHMNNQICLSDPIAGIDTDNYIKWEWQMRKNDVAPIADIAILFSRQCRDFGTGDMHRDEALGISESLSDAHIMHDFLFDEEITYKTLKKYKLLILPNVSCISDAQIEEISKFVKSGGRLFSSGNTSQNDEMGFQRSEFGFNKLFKPKILNLEQESHEVTQIDIGKGKVSYTTSTPGILNCEPELRVGQKWEYTRDDKLHQFIISSVTDLIDEPCFKPIDVPEKVLLSLYADQKNNCLILNFLNASGVDMQAGDMLVSEQKENVFPEISEDISFELKVGGVADCFAVSPDFDGKQEIEAEKLNNGYVKFTINKELLNVCSSVFIYQ